MTAEMSMRKRSVAAAARAMWALPDGLEGLAVGGAELLAEDVDEPDFVVDKLLETGDVVMLTGREKDSLKTWQLLQLAVARILGTEWLGLPVKSGKPGRVLFISTETSKRNIARRLRAICQGLNIPVERVAPFLYVVAEPITVLPRELLKRTRDQAFERTKLAAAKVHEKNRRESIQRNTEGLAEGEARRLGRNVEALEAVLDSPPGTWSLICLDTLRQCLEGDENSSGDASRFTQGCRELARAAGCPVAVSHHTNKSGDASDARSSRGSVELTAGPDVLISVDTTGDYPTAHFKVRNHEAPPPVGYRLAVAEDGAVRLEVLAPCGRANEVGEDDVLAVLRAHADTGLTESKIRSLVAAAKGGKEGAKANAKVTTKKLEALEGKKLVARCDIRQRNGKTFDGWRLGAVGGVVEAKPIQRTLDEAMGDPTDV